MIIINLTRQQKIDAVLVTSILALIGGVGLYIYWYNVEIIGSNYYALPDANTPFYHQKYVFVAFERNMTDLIYQISIINASGDSVYQNIIFFYSLQNGKSLYYVNMTQFNCVNNSAIFRFYFDLRKWYSDPVEVVNNSYFIWA